MKRVGFVVLVGVLASGCANNPVKIPPPRDAESAGVGIAVTVRIHGMATYRADTIYFAKGCSKSDDKCAEQLVVSNYSNGGRVYLLNADPGEYKPVAAAFESGMLGDKSIYFAYFPEAMTAASMVIVQKGKFAYAGSYLVPASLGLCPDNAEPSQIKYADLIEPGAPKCGFWKMLMHKLVTGDYLFVGGKAYPTGSQTFHYHGTGYEQIEKPGESPSFFESAKSDLSGAGWTVGK